MQMVNKHSGVFNTSDEVLGSIDDVHVVVGGFQSVRRLLRTRPPSRQTIRQDPSLGAGNGRRLQQGRLQKYRVALEVLAYHR